MITRVYGKCSIDKQIIKDFVEYVATYFTLPSTTFNIRFVDPNTLTGQDAKDLRKYQAWILQNKSRNFTLTISTTVHSQKGILMCIGHELVHAKQYLKGELVDLDLDNDIIKYKGKIYTDWRYGKGYWLAPFELEAYGYEQALYETFILL